MRPGSRGGPPARSSLPAGGAWQAANPRSDDCCSRSFVDFFVPQWRLLPNRPRSSVSRHRSTPGTLDTHVASILLAEPGQGFKTECLDLMDESEVKSAAIVSGVDRPRWIQNLDTIAQDADRTGKGRSPARRQPPYAGLLPFHLVVRPRITSSRNAPRRCGSLGDILTSDICQQNPGPS